MHCERPHTIKKDMKVRIEKDAISIARNVFERIYDRLYGLILSM